MKARRIVLVVAALVGAGAACLALWPDPETRFLEAVREGDVETVGELLSERPEFARLAQRRKAGVKGSATPALHMALSRGHDDVVRLLVSHGASPDDYPHALLLARTVNIARYLIEQGADVNRPGKYGQTSLHFAASTGNVEMMKCLLAHGADVDVTDPRGLTPLHNAAREGRPEAAEILVSEGADIHAKSAAGKTPLDYAAMPVWDVDAYRIGPERIRRCRQVGSYLLSHGATSTAFELAWLGDLDRLAVRVGDDPSLVNAEAHEEPILFHAIRGGDREVVAYLLEQGAKLEVQGRLQQAPLHVAAYIGHADVAEALIGQGADVNEKGPWGETALHWAAFRGNADVAEVLLRSGAEPDIQTTAHVVDLSYRADDADPVEREIKWFDTREEQRRRGWQVAGRPRLAFTTGDTPLHTAAYWNHPEIVRLLVGGGAGVSAQNQWGQTPVHLAAVCGYAEVAEELLDAGADPGATTKTGVTAIHLAKRTKAGDLAKLLSRHENR